MDTVKRYDLKGLKYFLIGLIMSVFPIISIVGFILIIIGFFKLAHIKESFRSSRNYYIGAIIFAIIYAALIWMMIIPFLSLIPAIMYALMVLFEYKADKYMIFGCNEIAVENNDKQLSEKLMRIYRIYKIAMIVGCILSFFLAFIPFFGYVGIIVTALGLLIIKIFIAYRFYQTYEKYHIGHENRTTSSSAEGNAAEVTSGVSGTGAAAAGLIDENEKQSGSAGSSGEEAEDVKKPDEAEESTVTMLLQPDVELEYIMKKKKLPKDDEKTFLLDTGTPAVILNGISGTDRIEIDKDGFVLGRSKEKTDHRINSPSVSNVHAKILISDDGCFAEDMNSSNHTYINGKKIEANGEGSLIGKLENGDVLKLADEEFKVEISGSAPRTAESQDTDIGGYFIAELSETGEKTDIRKNSFTLGREKGSVDLKVSNDNTVGRLHATIHVDPETEKIYVKDENSSNGTFINGERLFAGEEKEVQDNDEIKLSEVVMHFRKTNAS